MYFHPYTYLFDRIIGEIYVSIFYDVSNSTNRTNSSYFIACGNNYLLS